jgi:ATPase subunit of ABC transporter with duplicated ATPase domains
MSNISLRAVGVLSPHPLFQNLTLTIGEGDRIGLIAANGGGKTTLLRCLAGLAEPTTGDIVRSRGMRVGYVEQDVPANLLGLPLFEVIRRALPAADRDTSEWRVDVVLDEFRAPAELRAYPLHALSGGWQRLALIARAWVAEPDMLLLDEPTNHLDLAKIQMLEHWISECRMPMVIASHDRRFLDVCTTRTLFLRPGTSRFYSHPYTRARQLLADDDAAHEAKVAKDTREVDRLRRNANELKNVGINSGSDLLLKKSKQLRDRATTLEQSLAPTHVDKSGEVRLANRGSHARLMLSIADMDVRTPDARLLFHIGKLDVFQHDRVIVLGQNGVGKSQFVRLLRGALSGGEVAGIRSSPSIVLGYIDQLMSNLPDDATPAGFIRDAFRPGEQRATSLLAGAGFSVDMQRRPIGVLSPGQKARLGLLALRLTAPNFYLMDEPTNHVDIAGQERLEAEILTQEATCIVVSHDRAFVEAVATRFLFVRDYVVEEVNGPELYYGALNDGNVGSQ